MANAQLAVASAQETLDLTRISAPIDGLVIAVNAQPGALAPSGYAVEIQSPSLQVIAAFTESNVASLEVGQAATATISAIGASVPGTVTEIALTSATSSSSSSVVTYDVTVSLTNPPAKVRSGMSASVAVTTASAADVLAVPATALSGSAGSYTVQVVDASGATKTVAVKVGLVTSSMAEIQGGLTAGETVVTGSSTAKTSTSSGSSSSSKSSSGLSSLGGIAGGAAGGPPAGAPGGQP